MTSSGILHPSNIQTSLHTNLVNDRMEGLNHAPAAYEKMLVQHLKALHSVVSPRQEV